MEFNDLLRWNDIDPASVVLALHKPAGAFARRALCVLSEEDKPAFAAYQSHHPIIQQSTLAKRPVMASFVPTTEGEMTFVGLFSKVSQAPILHGELACDPDFIRMLEAVTRPWSGGVHSLFPLIEGRLRFALEDMDQLADLKGRLTVVDPVARNYMRLADRTPLKVIEVARVPRLVPPMPEWTDLVLSAAELRTLPKDWAIRLAEWRGVYLIIDDADGARYVGSAYGHTNFLGRWRAHIVNDTGATVELAKRNPATFRFSILQRLDPDMDAAAVIAVENTWKVRLHTRAFGLNVN